MRDEQWQLLLDVIEGRAHHPLPVGFIIDCPWLPGWCGMTIADYLSSETLWLEANRRAVETFPDCIFLPGFWSEFGMCTEPSAFGSRCIFPPDEFPFAEKVLDSIEEIDDLPVPNPATDGLLPFMLNRLRWARPSIEGMGHKIRFSVSRGPLNVASFLMGTTEFLLALRTDPEPTHRLLRTVTDFLVAWHGLQRETFQSVDGMLVLDDIVGFIGEEDFVTFGLPYLRDLFDNDLTVKFFHNDAPCESSIGYYPEIGINLFNPGIHNSVDELQQLSEGKLTIMGNIPPRDVLAAGTPQDVERSVRDLLEQTSDHAHLLLSCGGGMPPGVSTENILAFLEASRRYSSLE